MWSFITIGRLFRAIRDAVVNRDFAGLIAAAKELAELLGFAPEAKELAELIASASAGDWAGTLRNLGEFLIAVSERFAATVTIMVGDPLDASLKSLEDTAELGKIDDAIRASSTDAKLNPLPVILAIIQLIRFIRELRGKKS